MSTTASVDHRLQPLKKHELQYKYPTGPTVNDDPAKKGVPDNRLLNRHEWYEMLYFVNKFANTYGHGARSVALHAEVLIHTKVPANLHSHEHITQWLLNNWS